MIKNIYLLLFILSFTQVSFSQEIEFGEVSKEELSEKFYEKQDFRIFHGYRKNFIN